MSNWQKVFETDVPYRAEIVKDVLEGHHLESIIINKQDSSYNNFGQYEIHVIHDHVLKALKIIKDEIDFN